MVLKKLNLSNFKIAKQIPFDVLLKRIIKKVIPSKRINYSAQDFRNTPTQLKLNSFLDSSKLKPETDSKRIEHYLNHEFDLLGSGWLSRNAGKSIQVHSNHQKITQEIASLIDKDYQIINWQKDVKTGYEYDVTKAFNEQNTPAGVDIKDLWELGRLQHLPQLALASKKEEFRNQCLDFIAHNPVGMGVNWVCAMDVGIRVCNLLLAYDILKQDFDNEFKQVFTNSVYQHGWFIYNNLEHKEGAAGNHYLFNLVGLLFAGYYLGKADWKNFSREEMQKETFKQFFKDGGNFEGSTTYHCLSAEAVLYATALMLRDGELDEKYAKRIRNIAHFIVSISKIDGTIPQFGDNDSGRLFKLGNEDENLLNYNPLINAFAGIGVVGSNNTNSKTIVEQLANGNKIDTSENISNVFLDRTMSLSGRTYSQESIIKYGDKIDLSKLKYYAFDDFGFFVYKSEEFYLAVSAIANDKIHHSWGHVHNDKLSFELNVKGKDLVRDAGSYLYTSDAAARNEYRSTKAHHSIIVNGVEQNKMIAPFYMDRECVCKLLSTSPNEIILQAIYYGVIHERRFVIEEDQLVITDYCNKPFEVNINKFESYSPSYGIR